MAYSVTHERPKSSIRARYVMEATGGKSSTHGLNRLRTVTQGFQVFIHIESSFPCMSIAFMTIFGRFCWYHVNFFFFAKTFNKEIWIDWSWKHFVRLDIGITDTTNKLLKVDYVVMKLVTAKRTSSLLFLCFVRQIVFFVVFFFAELTPFAHIV